ncbi:cobalamin synthesis protein, P47K [Roseibium sp. TrichSKD4]|uniref:CobW family GTP-binding protein n=1 Tax=Roseibium sp. TrichSKD4 TaxID=744980 RepID=UPI0001E5719F|nr:GTP-binding protein [Roseibium sp. TrichSKD4]EFO28741.1 cobalamin synthesis protein, P47K [Roseibium sp. TrichSKD4]
MNNISVFLLTGFLGAGKSTLLNRLLSDPDFADTAVVINEFGDIAIDHDLVHVGKTQVARTTTGCMCCTAGSDIRTTLYELHTLAEAGETVFKRVIVETTGLADPAPLINDLIPGGSPAIGLRDHIVARNFELAGVVTLVDIETGTAALQNHFEATKQIAFADRLLLTKTDLVNGAELNSAVERLKAGLLPVNPSAPILDSSAAGFVPADLFRQRAYMPASLGDDVIGWLALEAAIRSEVPAAHGNTDAVQGVDRHAGRIRTFTLTREQPVEPETFRKFMGLLSDSAGPRLLRAKGIVNLAEDCARPAVVHAVQHMVYPLRTLDAWPDEDHRTRLVFITDGIDPEPVRQLFEAALDNRPSYIYRRFTEFGAQLKSLLHSAVTQPRRGAPR